jgi:predicted nucleic acid-binding protein
MRVYLDPCCLSRLTDDQSQARIRQEAEAVEQVIHAVGRKAIKLLSSEALHDEVCRNPSLERRRETQTILSSATTTIKVDQAIALRAQALFELGYGPFDALHIAAAEAGGADVLLTTDDGLLKRAARNLGSPQIQVRNPVSWIQEQEL